MKTITTKGPIKFGGILLTCILLVSVFAIAPALAQGNSRNNDDRCIVKVKDGFSPAEVAQDLNIPTRHVYEYALNGFATAKIPLGKRGELESDFRVAYVEIDQKVHTLEDTLPWGVDRIDAEIVWGGGGNALDVTGNAGGGQQVAVVDTGIDYTHPDLDGVYLNGYDFANGDDDPKDDHGHGTHVSGTIAAEDEDGDVLGVAPEAGLYALKALDKRGSGYISDVVAGIDWAIKGPDGTEGNEDDAEVVSMSLGGPDSKSLQDAVDSAFAQGTLPVAAAGNDGDGDCSTTETSYPAAYDSVIAVGATDKDDSIASFSNSGDYLELVAPGVDILSTMPTYHVYLNGPYHKSQNYDTLSGTSMACPHVSGTAALVFAAGATDSDGDGNIADDVRRILDSTAENLGCCSNCQGYGLVDAEAAEGAVSPTTDIAVTDVNAPDSVVKGDNASIDVTVKNVGNQHVSDNIRVTLKDNTAGENIGTRTITGGLDAGSSEILTFSWNTSDVPPDDHTLRAWHDFDDDDPTNDSETTTVTVESQITDIAVTDVSASGSVVENDNVAVSVTVKNVGNQDVSDNIDVTLEDNTDNKTIGTKRTTGGLSAGDSTTLTYTWDTTGASIDNHKLVASHDYSDENSSNDSETTTVEVKESTGGPTIERFDITEIISPNPHIEFSVDWVVSDGDGDLEEVNLVLEDNNGNEIDSATESISSSTASGTTELKDKQAEGEGKTYYITLTVYDGDGNKSSDRKQAQ